MNMMTTNTRDYLLSLCHLVRDRNALSALRKACQIYIELNNAQTAALFLFNSQRTHFYLASAIKSGDANFAPDALQIEMMLEREGLVCPISNAVVLAKTVEFEMANSAYSIEPFSTLFGDAFSWLKFQPMNTADGGTLGVMLTIGADETLIKNSALNDLIEEAVSVRVSEVIEQQVHKEESERLRKSLSVVTRDREQLKNRLQKHGSKFVGKTAKIKDLRKKIEQYAQHSSPVLLLGDQGTMRTQAAREIHQISDVSDGRFVSIDAAMIAEGSEIYALCGAKRGAIKGVAAAHTGVIAQASEGTLFIENVDKLSMTGQKILLDVIDTRQVQAIGSERRRQVNVRLIASAETAFLSPNESENFMPSLTHSLSTFVAHVPNLQQRLEDFEELLQQVLDEYSEQYKRDLSFDAGAAMLLRTRDYPGNIRELRALVFKLCNMARDQRVITASMVRDFLNHDQIELETHSFRDAVSHFERSLIKRALIANDGSRTAAAHELNIPKRTLAEKCRKYQL